MQDKGDDLQSFTYVVSKRICGAEEMSLEEFDIICAAVTQRAVTPDSAEPRKHTLHPEMIDERKYTCMGAGCASYLEAFIIMNSIQCA